VCPLNLEFSRGAHVCHVVENHDEAKALTLRFLVAGLRKGEYCACIAPEDRVDDWYFELQANGIDVMSERRARALAVISAAEWRNPGEFNSIVMARSVWRMIDGALANSPGVRLVQDMAWALEPLLPEDQLCHWEACADLLVKETDARAICQYDRNAHSPANIHAALRTHPVVLLDGRQVANPFYEAKAILDNEPALNHSSADARQLDEMIQRLRETK